MLLVPCFPLYTLNLLQNENHVKYLNQILPYSRLSILHKIYQHFLKQEIQTTILSFPKPSVAAILLCPNPMINTRDKQSTKFYSIKIKCYRSKTFSKVTNYSVNHIHCHSQIIIPTLLGSQNYLSNQKRHPYTKTDQIKHTHKPNQNNQHSTTNTKIE